MHQLLCKEKRSYAFTEHCCENRTSAHIYKRENKGHQPNQSRVTRSFSLARRTHHKLKITTLFGQQLVVIIIINIHTFIHTKKFSMAIWKKKNNSMVKGRQRNKQTTSMINQQYDKLASTWKRIGGKIPAHSTTRLYFLGRTKPWQKQRKKI